MSVATPPTPVRAPGLSHLSSVATAFADHAAEEPSIGILIVVVRPSSNRHEVIAGGGNGVLRAAMSVAVASGHDRLWNDLPDGVTIERAVASLPEVVRAAADGTDVVTVHAGSVRVDGGVACAAFWFETSVGVASLDDRHHVLGLLAAAAVRDAAAAAEADEAAGREAAGHATEEAAPYPGDRRARPTVERTFDPDDPDLDELTGLTNAERFADMLADFDADEAAIVQIDLDDLAAVEETHGTEIADRIVRISADRVVDNLRGSDLVGRLGRHRLGVLLSGCERSIAVTIAKRLMAAVSEPLDIDGGPDSITATVALAHQDGLVDTEELIELTDAAVDSARRSGSGRLVLAS